MTVLNLAECSGMLDRDESAQHSVHHWLMRAAVEKGPRASITILNASFTERHPKRYPCYAAFVLAAIANPSTRFAGVSFHTSFFMPRYGHPTAPRNIWWAVMEPTRPSVPQIVTPYVVSSPFVDRPIPWKDRSLLFIAGHIPKRKFSSVRAQAVAFLKTVPDATARNAERLNKTEYARMMTRHKFCVVAPGDTPSTHKLAETIVWGARGACIPFILGRLVKPYSTILNYASFAIIENRLTAEVVARLRRVTEDEYTSLAANLRRVESYFVQPDAGRALLHQLEVG